MRYAFTPEDEAFRQEVRDFYKKELPVDWGQRGGQRQDGASRDLTKKVKKLLAERGWLCMAWPKEHGGLGAPISRQMIFAEESSLRRFPARDQGVSFLGPAIMSHGTPEQKERFLGPIARAEVSFHQGFSEADAGSDLASLTTRADHDGDFYVINGSKMWGGEIDTVDYSFLLVRTDQEAPKHRGISFLVIPAKTPGIKWEKLENLGGGTQNIVYYDNCRVPVQESLVGEENRGWYMATTALNLERTMVEHAVNGGLMVNDLFEHLRETGQLDGQSGARAVLRHKLAEMAVEIEVCRMLSYRIGWLQAEGLDLSYQASVIKIFGSEMTQRLSQVGMEVLGLYSQIDGKNRSKKHVLLQGRVDHNFRQAPGYTLMGGTSEIQRGLIASRGLGLPRS